MMRRLDVWWDGRIVGMLTQDRFGELGFGYSLAWLDDVNALPLSASLPKRAEPFTRRECRPFFGGLLPEESQRDAAALIALSAARGPFDVVIDDGSHSALAQVTTMRVLVPLLRPGGVLIVEDLHMAWSERRW